MRNEELSAEPARSFTADRGSWLAGWIERPLLRALGRSVGQGGCGRLQLHFPSGRSETLGRGDDGPVAELTMARYRSLWRLAKGGANGFAESYMRGEIDSDDLGAVLRFYVANRHALEAALPALSFSRWRDRRYHARRRNTRRGSRRNIAAHYDLGNSFYELWLDREMVYSSAVFEHAGQSLEEAQQWKLKCVLDAAEVASGQRILEIGCGWGALAEAAARRGATVRAITLSHEQFRAASDRFAGAGLDGRVTAHIEDYRDTVGTFDRIVSVEMIEAVGEESWPLYFSTIADRLAPGGVAGIQAITIGEEAFEAYRRNPDFIQRWIFPGGMLPTVSSMRRDAEAAGLVFEPVRCFAPSYAATLAEWRRRFLAAWPRIAAQGFDERFRRMWLYYLTYCEVGFEAGMIDVGLYRLRKPLRAAATRTDLTASP
jgi:cyclopropane-fatty-acyl-phospholipid synthase